MVYGSAGAAGQHLFAFPKLISWLEEFVAQEQHCGVALSVSGFHGPPALLRELWCLPVWSSVDSWLLRLQSGSVFAPAQLLAPTVLHMSTPVRRGAVADSCMGLAWCLICCFLVHACMHACKYDYIGVHEYYTDKL